MEAQKSVGLILVALAIVIILFGIWIKLYNDRLALMRINETGSCYLTDGTCLHTTSDSIMYGSIGIAALVFAAGSYLFFKKKEVIIKTKRIIETEKAAPKKAEKTEKTDITGLSDESKQIYDLIRDSNGAILQGEIVGKSGMDKVKVSRVLDKLEMRGLIERRRHGMSNLIVLKNKE